MSSPHAPSLDGIAIIGMAGRFPGARDIEAFWDNLINGVESVTSLTDLELAEAGVDPALVRDPAYVKARALLEGVELFDAGFFGYTPADAANMDPQQRVFLECAWEAVEHAGYDVARHAGAVGLFAGHGLNTYLLANLCAGREWIDEFLDGRNVGSFQTFLGNDKDYLTSRVAYQLNLRGPAVTVQTACSTSLTAVCLACQSLLAHQSDMALAGGVSITFPQKKGYLYREGGITSPDGHCRAFDARAQGTVFGSGAGVVVLKRVADAVADGDCIYAVIRGSALNNDGALKVSYTAPGVDGQAEAILMAQTVAGVAPDTIGYIEAHGTGTLLGDPIEFAALTQAFRVGTERRQFCALGSVKTNIGHLDAAAGIAGLIKTALALHHRIVPPSLHFEQPNPQIDFDGSPFFVNTALIDWPTTSGTPRRAGVSSFGVGGTNAHVVLEEAPAVPLAEAARPAQLLVLSARSEAALEEATTNLRGHLRQHPRLNLADIAYTLQVGRREFAHRRAVVCRDAADAVALLETRAARRVATHVQHGRDVPVVFLFPGQGAQAINMGRALRKVEPVFCAHLDHCLALASAELGCNLGEIICPLPGKADEAERVLADTRFTQPALFAIEYSLAQLWISWGIKPAAMIGHSLGEYVAACLAGVFSLEAATSLVVKRARLVHGQDGGAMLAVRLSSDELKPWLAAPLSLAAVNAPKLSVASGPVAEVSGLEQRLREAGISSIRLKTSHAFHSAMMDPALAPLAAEIGKLTLGAPKIPWLSNVTGRWITDREATSPDYWATHLRETVRFADSVAEVSKTPGQVLLEVGPGQTLAALARQHPAAKASAGIFSSFEMGNDEPAAILSTLGKLWLAGVSPHWPGFYADEKRRRVPLPSYPFERKRHFVEPPLREPMGGPGAPRAAFRVDVAPAARGAPGPPPESLAASPRDRIAAELFSLFRELSGVDLRAEHRAVPLIELGFDSLFLTQVRQSFQSRFGVNITYRELAESLNTIDALATHIAERADPGPDFILADPAADVRSPSAPATIPGLLAPGAEQPPLDLAKAESLGPYRPPDKSNYVAFTAKQQTWLAEFTARYNRRTAASKRIAAENHHGVADPRSLANYRPHWKELVYQIVVEASAGARLRDVDGNDYLDVTMGFGANLFGHSPAFVTDAITAQLRKGVPIGPQSPLTGEVAALIRDFTGMERVTFCNTGSEAVMAALRVARTVTRRGKIVYFAGDYHGLFDEVLMRPHHGDDVRGSLPGAPGIPPSAGANAIVLDYGTPASLEIIRQLGPELAAVLVEPVQSRNPELQPREFLHELRRLTHETGTVLIFDEVITGFRLHPGGAQAWFDVRADLAAYGKVIGGGLPCGVLAGSARCMDALDGGAWNFGDASGPEADITFFAGTFVRHPLALAAARAALLHLKERGPELQAGLNSRTAALAGTLNAFFEAGKLAIRIRHFGSLFRFYFPPELPHAPLLVYQLLDRGIYFRDAHQNCFLSTAHTDGDVARFIAAVKAAVTELQEAAFLPRQKIAPPPAPFALTAAQQEIWLACQWNPDLLRAYNQSLTLDLRGPLDLPALQAGWQEILGRHEALRLVISLDGESQQVGPAPAGILPLIDWSVHPEAERATLLAGIAAAEGTQAFDLSRGPLVRARVCRLTPDHHRFVFTAHHLVCDGWSVGVIVAELGKLYSANRNIAHPASPILEPAASFREFAHGHAARRGGAAFLAAEHYWLTRFSTLPPALELPRDHPRTAATANRGGSERAQIGPTLPIALKQIGGRHGATLFATLLAAFKVLLRRLSGQDETVVGIFTSGRAHAGAGPLVGHCVNLLPIRSGMADDTEFGQFLAEINRLVLDARDHEEHGYGELVKKLQLPRQPGRPPLIGALFNLEQKGDTGVEFAGLEVDLDQNAKEFVNFDLFLNIRESPAGLILDFAYNRGRFEPATIRRWLGHYRTLLDGIAVHPELPLDRLPLLDPAERKQILVEWNATTRDFPRESRLHELFEARVKLSAGAAAVTEGSRTITYGELDQRAERLAERLRGLNVGPEVRVALCLDRSVALIVGILGTLEAGAAYVPIDPRYPRDRLAFMLHDSGAAVLLTTSGWRAKLPPSNAHVICLDDDGGAGVPPANSSASGRDARAPTSGDLAYIIYTSGSTGRPKGVMVEHRAIVNHLAWRQRTFPLGAGDSFLQKASSSFDISVWEIFAPLLAGARLVLARPGGQGDAAYLAKLIDAEKITDVHFGPAMLRLTLDEFGPGGGGSLRRVFCGGEPLSGELQEHFRKNCRAALISQYGPTEATVDATWFPCDSTTTGAAAPIGRPIDNTQACIVDRQFQPVPPGVPGELCLAGESLARGYLNVPELTAEKFVRHSFDAGPPMRLYRTGDRCRYRPDGVIEYLGRLDTQVKIRGYRIEPGEIEVMLTGHRRVRDVVVSAHEDQFGDKRLVAYVVPAPANGSAVPGEDEHELFPALRDFLGATLPAYMVPDLFVGLAMLPLLPNGKVDRRALPAPDGSRRMALPAVAPPATATEKILAAIWCDVLRVTQVSAADNFFALGGHSLLAIRVVARVRTAFKVELPMQRMFEAATLAALATLVEDLLLEHIAALSDEEARRAIEPELLPAATPEK